MATKQIDGTSDVTSTSTVNNGGVFLGGVGNNDAPITTQQNSGFNRGDYVVSGVNNDVILSNGTFLNDNDRGVIMRATDTIANTSNDFLKSGAGDGRDPVDAQRVSAIVSLQPKVQKVVEQYNYSKKSSTVKTATAIRNGNWDEYSGDFDNGYPQTSTGYWVNDLITDNGLCVLDANNSTSYGGSGSTWSDLSSGGYDGTLTNGPTFTAASNGNPASFDFDGSNQYIDTTLNYTGTGDFTVGIWMKTPYIQKCGLIGHRSGWYADGENSQTLFYITHDTSASKPGAGFGWFQWWVQKTAPTGGGYGGRTMYFPEKNICDNQWHNLVAVNGPRTTKVYLDGVIIGETASQSGHGIGFYNKIPIGPNTRGRYIVGGAPNGPPSVNLNGFYYRGSISQSYFYSKAFSDVEVSRNYLSFKNRYLD